MPFRCRPAFRAIRPLARTVAMALAALLVLAAPPAPAQGLFDQIQELGKKIQESVPKNERPGTAATTAPRNGTGSGGISAERRAAMALQQGLNDLGFDAGVVDGLPGAQTRAAIGRFQ
uniref:peptidoglycan-binding domain-containing protein n=1 Tax=Meridianimarinicoccus zhengii TaxID=2056810 RepID=UPI0013A698BA